MCDKQSYLCVGPYIMTEVIQNRTVCACIGNQKLKQPKKVTLNRAILKNTSENEEDTKKDKKEGKTKGNKFLNFWQKDLVTLQLCHK